MKTAGVLFVFSVTLCAAQKQKPAQKPEWDYKNEAERVNTRGCTNLTLVLDNWKYAIMSQVKDLLLHDHSTVLPDYGRIQRLSDALQDLYKDFDGLKERLAGLTTRFHRVEAFVDGARPGRKRAGAAGGAGGAGGRPPGRRSRVVVRRIQKPAGSH